MAEILQLDKAASMVVSHDWEAGSVFHEAMTHGSGAGFARTLEVRKTSDAHRAMFEFPLDDIDS